MSTMIDRYLDHKADIAPVYIKEEQRKLDNLRRANTRLLPVEAAARTTITERIAEQHTLLGQAKIANRYKQLSLEPLSWRHDERLGGGFEHTPLPVFAIVNVFSESGMRISAMPTEFRPVLPGDGSIYKIYADVRLGLGQTHEIFMQNRFIHWMFTGVIPQKTRDLILACKNDFTQDAGRTTNIFLICETQPQEWRGEVTLADPLVAGWAHNTFWLIDRFDPTSLESYIAQEFTS